MPAVAPPTAATVPPRTIPGGLADSSGSLRLPALHFTAAVLFLLLGSVALVGVAPELAAGAFLSPRVVGTTHLFTLGWLTTTIFGALHQLLPVALGAPIRSTSLGHVGFWGFAPGVALFACGVLHSLTTLQHAGIALLTVGVVVTVVNVGLSLPRARSRDVTWWGVTIALGFLTFTLALGVVLLHNLHTGMLHERRIQVLTVHLHVAIVGWAVVMMVGISHRLLPMFLLAHGADTRWSPRALVLLPVGLVLLTAGLLRAWPPASWAGLVGLEAGVFCFLRQCRAFYSARRRPRLDVGLRFAALALGFVALAALLAPVVLAVGGARAPRMATTYVLVGLLGGIILYVVGHFYKIVPFLAWIARFGRRVGREQVPTVADLYSPHVAHAQLALMALGVTGMAVGVLAAHAPLVRMAASSFLLGVVLHAFQMARVARGAAFTTVRGS